MQDKKTILVIGASSEIASAIMTKLRKADYTILTTSRTGEDTTYSLDLTNGKSMSEFEADIGDTPLYFILYCAGFIKSIEPTEHFTGGYANDSEQVNFSSAARLLNKFSRNIVHGGGAIALSSTAAIWGNPQFPIYSSWKGALNTFIQSLNKQQKESGRHFFSICPGPTNTQMREVIAGDADKQQSPNVVADYIVKVLEHPKEYSQSPILIIRDGALYNLEQELVLIQ